MDKPNSVIESRLELVKSAQRRSSLSYLISVIIAASFILTIYTSLFSWDRRFCFKDEFSENEITAILQKALIQNWVNNRMVKIDLLGLKVSASDFTVLGGLGLAVLSIWFLLNVKRENSVVGTFLIESKNYIIEDQKYIYNYISSNQIFSNAFNEDKPIHSLKLELESRHIKEKFINKIDEYLFYLPCLGVFLSLLADIGSLFLKSPFRDKKAEPLYKTLFESQPDVLAVIYIITVGLTLTIFSFALNHRARQYEIATKCVLKEYSEMIELKQNK